MDESEDPVPVLASSPPTAQSHRAQSPLPSSRAVSDSMMAAESARRISVASASQPRSPSLDPNSSPSPATFGMPVPAAHAGPVGTVPYTYFVPSAVSGELQPVTVYLPPGGPGSAGPIPTAPAAVELEMTGGPRRSSLINVDEGILSASDARRTIGPDGLPLRRSSQLHGTPSLGPLLEPPVGYDAEAALEESILREQDRRASLALAESRPLTEAEKEMVLYKKAIDKRAQIAARRKPLGTILAILVGLAGLGYVLYLTRGISSTDANPLVGPTPATLVSAGAKVVPLIVGQKEWWRLGSALWLHAGVVETVACLTMILKFGIIVEKRISFFPFALVYIWAGVAGVLASCVFASESVTTGGPAAAFGISGAYVAHVIQNRQERKTKTFLWDLIVTLVMIAMTLLIGFIGNISDNWTNVAGLVAGFGLGAVFITNRGPKGTWSICQIATAAVSFAGVVSMTAAFAVMTQYKIFSTDFAPMTKYLTCIPLKWWSCSPSILMLPVNESG